METGFIYKGHGISLAPFGYWLVYDGWDAYQVPLKSSQVAMDFVDKGEDFMQNASLRQTREFYDTKAA
jgi:hypothetical protein